MITINKKELVGTELNNGNFYTKDKLLWNQIKETFKGKRPSKKAVLNVDGVEYSYSGHNPFSRSHGWPENYSFKSCIDGSPLSLAFLGY